MSLIAEYLNNHRTVKTVDFIVEDTLAFLKTRSEVLGKIAPIEEKQSKDLRGIITNQLVTPGKLIGYGQEIPTAKSGNFREVRASMFKMGLQHIYPEELQWRMLDAMKLANLQGVPVENVVDSISGKVSRRGSDNDLAIRLFGDVANLVRGIMDQFDAWTWEAIQTGKVQFTSYSNETLNLDYTQGASVDMSLHFPADLVATGDPIKKNNMWSDHENANGLQNLYDLHEVWIDDNGSPADMIILGRRAYNNLQQQQTTKDAARSTFSSSVGTVSPQMLNETMIARGLPPIKIIDDQYQSEDAYGNLVNTKFIQPNRATFVKKNMASRYIGATIESVQEVVGGGASIPQVKTGIFVETKTLNKDTNLDATKAVMTGLPLIHNPKHLASQVIDAIV